MLNKEQLDAIKERVEIATPGEWGLGIYRVYNDEFKAVAETLRFEDAKFIAHARQDVPALIAEVERLREALGFYADEQKYTLAYDSNLVGTVEIFKDNGKKARQALGDSDE